MADAPNPGRRAVTRKQPACRPVPGTSRATSHRFPLTDVFCIHPKATSAAGKSRRPNHRVSLPKRPTIASDRERYKGRTSPYHDSKVSRVRISRRGLRVIVCVPRGCGSVEAKVRQKNARKTGARRAKNAALQPFSKLPGLDSNHNPRSTAGWLYGGQLDTQLDTVAGRSNVRRRIRLEREADARTRTGDPFITRERQVRDARPLAAARGRVFAGNWTVLCVRFVDARAR
jgi:hypothetical protein